MSEASLKQDKGESVTFNIQGNVRSSTELLKRFKIKREKLVGNAESTNATRMEVQGPIHKHMFRSQFESTSQNKLQVEPSITQPKGPSQNQDPTSHFVSTSQKKLPLEPAITQPRASKQNNDPKKLPMHAVTTKSKGSSQNQDPKSHFVSTSQTMLPKKPANTQPKGSRQNHDPNKLPIMTQSKGSSQNQHPKSQPVNTNQNKLPMKASMDQNKGPSQKEGLKRQAMKKAMAQDDESRSMQQIPLKKTKRIRICPPMLIDEFLEENGEVGEQEEIGNESEDEEQNDIEQEEDALKEEGGEINGAPKKRTRGPTQCLSIHARPTQDRQEVILDDYGEPIGPTDKIVSDLSYFLGTIARNTDFCPLIYTNFKAVPSDYKDRMWEYVNDKYLVPNKGRKAVFSRINDAWRRYKTSIKKKHFIKYSNLRERLIHRPNTIPEAHFRQLMAYWNHDAIQKISQKNAANRAKHKYIHRMGPKNFARIRAQLRAKKKNGGDVLQAEMFVETRQSRNGKEVDPETQVVITTLKDSIQNSTESAGQTFQSLFGKEKSGKVRCFERTATPSMLKRNEEIAVIKKQHSNEMNKMHKKVDGLESLVRSLLKQTKPNLDEEALDDIMANALGNENSTASHSSTSTHVPNNEKEDFHGEEEQYQGIEEE